MRVDDGGDVVVYHRAAETILQICPHVAPAQILERDLPALTVHAQRRHDVGERVVEHRRLRRPIGTQEHDSRPLGPLREHRYEIHRALVAPVQVLQDQYQRAIDGDRLHQARELTQHAVGRRVDVPAPGLSRVGGRVKRGHPRQPARSDGAQRGEQPVSGRSVAQPLQGLQGRHVGLPLAVLLHALAIADQDAVGRRPQRVQERLDDRGLADAGFALHEHHLALAGGRGLEDGPERRELGVAAHQGCGGSHSRGGRGRDRRLEAPVPGRGPLHSGDEANPPAVNGLDDARHSWIVPKSPPQLAQRLRERVVRHDDIAPNGRVELFLRDQRAGPLGQIAQQSPGLGSQFHWAVAMPQASLPQVQPVRRKLDHHAREGGRSLLEKFPPSLGTSPARLAHDPGGEEMAPVSTRARTAEGLRTLRQRRVATRGNAFISRGYHALETPIGPKSYRRRTSARMK